MCWDGFVSRVDQQEHRVLAYVCRHWATIRDEFVSMIPSGSTNHSRANSRFSTWSQIAPTLPLLRGMVRPYFCLNVDNLSRTSGQFSRKSQATKKIFRESGWLIGRDQFDSELRRVRHLLKLITGQTLQSRTARAQVCVSVLTIILIMKWVLSLRSANTHYILRRPTSPI